MLEFRKVLYRGAGSSYVSRHRYVGQARKEGQFRQLHHRLVFLVIFLVVFFVVIVSNMAQQFRCVRGRQDIVKKQSERVRTYPWIDL